MKNFFQWLKNLINGNKTIIGTLLLMLINMNGVSVWLGSWYDILVWLIGILTGIAGISHVAKQKKKKRSKTFY